MVFYLKGNPIECNTGKFDYSTVFEGVTDSLVQYDEKSNTVTVDKRASDSYAKYATIHECICCGRYQSMFPWKGNISERCGEIDKMLISLMPESEREPYIEKRIKMFEILLDKDLNPALNETFRHSLHALEQA